MLDTFSYIISLLKSFHFKCINMYPYVIEIVCKIMNRSNWWLKLNYFNLLTLCVYFFKLTLKNNCSSSCQVCHIPDEVNHSGRLNKAFVGLSWYIGGSYPTNDFSEQVVMGRLWFTTLTNIPTMWRRQFEWMNKLSKPLLCCQITEVYKTCIVW